MKAFVFACSCVLSLGWNDENDYAALLFWHNIYRCMHDVPLLTWNDNIAASAQSWANQCQGTMQHSSNEQRQNIGGFNQLGENLYGGGAQYEPYISGKEGAQMWYNEIQSTNNGLVSGFGMNTGHYTQLVWKGTTSFGCGHSTGLVVCQYGEAGNMMGDFESNVNSPGKTEEECKATHGSDSPISSPRASGGGGDTSSDGTCANTADDSACEYWKSQGWCSPTSTYYAYNSVNCKKTCETCGHSEGSPSPSPSSSSSWYYSE